MATATITFSDDDENTTVRIRLDFGALGSDETSGAHCMAAKALALLSEAEAASLDDEE
jgi:hypothetical protein